MKRAQEKLVMRYAVCLAMAAAAGLAAATGASAEEAPGISTAAGDGAAASAIVITGPAGQPENGDDAAPRVKVIEFPNPGSPPDALKRMKITFLGVVTSPVSEALGEKLGLARGAGLVVEFVEPDSPADRAGLCKYDVLVRFEDQLLVNQPQLAVLVRMRKPGERVILTLKRDATQVKIPILLKETERLVSGKPAFAAWPTARMSALDRKSLAELLLRMPPHEGPWQEHGLELLKLGSVVSAVIGASGVGDGVAATASVSMCDGEHTLSITYRDGEKYLVAKDVEGAVIFEGPVQTDEQRNEVPEDILRKLDSVNVLVNPITISVEEAMPEAEQE